jgi:hypothetical protein
MTFVCAALTNVMFCASPVSTYAECWLKRRLKQTVEVAFSLDLQGLWEAEKIFSAAGIKFDIQ